MNKYNLKDQVEVFVGKGGSRWMVITKVIPFKAKFKDATYYRYCCNGNDSVMYSEDKIYFR